MIRRAIIRIILVLLGVGALLSFSAYIVQKQNDDNTTAALTAAMPHAVPPVSLHSIEQSSAIPLSSTANDAIDTDTATIRYKTVSGPGYSFEAPITWNSFQSTVGKCTTETIVSPQKATIDITPVSCVTHQYVHTTSINSYGISTDTADNTTYNHTITTFHIIK